MSNSSEKMQSVKELILDNQLFIDVIRKKKSDLEKDYNSFDKVKEEFLLTMLSRGYIDENYSDFLSESYEGQFTNDEFAYIENLREEREPNFKLKIEHIYSVKKKILPYKWIIASVLNNDILTNILKNKEIDKLNQILKAIANYSRLYKKNGFLEQYIDSINHEKEKDEFVNTLLDCLSKDMDSDKLSIFSENTGTLFCRMVDEKIDDITKNKYNEIIALFLKSNAKILEEILVESVGNKSLKEKLEKIDVEVEHLSDYSRMDVQQLLIDGAMFQISKNNLDYILQQKTESQNNLGYDYFTQYDNIWKKITSPNNINSFVENIILNSDELNFSEYKIGEFLFNEKVEKNNVDNIIAKIGNESLYLEALPKYLKENINNPSNRLSNTTLSLLDQNKLHLDFNNILYVYKLYPAGLIQFAKKVFDKYEFAIKNKKINLEKVDEYAKENYLGVFFDAILVTPKIDDELFENFSELMLYYNIDVIKLMISAMDLLDDISTTKTQILVKQIFKKSNINKASISDFIKIISKGFGDVSQNIGIIKDKCIRDWDCKGAWIQFLSILLKNEDNILEKKQIDAIMGIVSLEDFGSVINKWSERGDGKQDISSNVKKLLIFDNLKLWVKQYGRLAVIDFLDNNKGKMDIYLVNNMKANIKQNINSSIDYELAENEASHIKKFMDITRKYKLYPRAIFGRQIKLTSLFEPLATALQYDAQKALNWNVVINFIHDIINRKAQLQDILEVIQKNSDFSKAKKKALSLLTPGVFNKTSFRSDLFVVGRYFYTAMEKGKIEVSEFSSFEANDLLKISSIFSLNPLLSGAVFEGYFDNDGNLKKSFNDVLFRLSSEIGNDRNSEGYEFIRECLAIFRYDLDSNIASIFNL